MQTPESEGLGQAGASPELEDEVENADPLLGERVFQSGG
jgi:hypothetical protein